METISRLIYPAYSLALSPKMIKEINKLNFNFIGKINIIRKSSIKNEMVAIFSMKR